MRIEKKKIKDMERNLYNTRVELTPKEKVYKDIDRSITTYGMILPIVWNKKTNHVINGQQRLTILENKGKTDVEVSVVELDEKQEKQLHIALNKIEGDWEEQKLITLLEELGEDATFTGFTQQEIDSLTNDIESLIDNDAVEKELKEIESTFNITLKFDKSEQKVFQEYMKHYGKETLVQVIIQKAKESIA